MNDRYLYRAKRNDNRKWVEGFLMDDNYINTPFNDNDVGGRFDDPVEIDPSTICQCTGLMDNNGKLIFENDIVVCKEYVGGNHVDYCIEKGYVEMLYGAFGLHRKNGYYRPFKDWLENYEYEVIGNIYDNPELLE